MQAPPSRDNDFAVSIYIYKKEKHVENEQKVGMLLQS